MRGGGVYGIIRYGVIILSDKEAEKMRVGISTASLFLKCRNEEAVALYNEWGVPSTEVFLSTFSEYGKEYGKLLAEKKGNVSVNSVHDLTEQFEPQLYAACDRVRADAFYWLGKVMESAREVGAKYYTFHGVSRIKRRGNYDNFGFLSPQTKTIADFCKDYGVTLAYENVEWAVYNRPGVFRRLKEQCPDLKGVLDVKQARISGYPYGDYIKDMGEDLAYVHFSDADGAGNTCLSGRGTFDVEEMVRRLSDVGFTGDILIENYARDFEKIEDLRASYEYLREKIDKLTR